MKKAESYSALVAQGGRVAFIIPVQEKAPFDSYLVYNGGNDAWLYRSPSDVLLLNEINENVQPFLKKAVKAVIIEVRPGTDEAVYDYEAPLCQAPTPEL